MFSVVFFCMYWQTLFLGVDWLINQMPARPLSLQCCRSFYFADLLHFAVCKYR